MALPLKVFILGVPNCKPNARVFIKCSMSGFGWARSGGGGGGPWGTHPPSGHAGMEGGDGCPGGTHPPPFRKVTSWLPSSAFLLPDGCPQGIGAGLLGGSFNSQSVISWQRSSTSWCSSWSARLPSSVWRWHGVSLLGWGFSWGEWGSPSTSEGCNWSYEESPPTAIIYALTWFSEGATAWIAMASPHNSVTLMVPCVAHCISSVEQNKTTDSIAE